MRVPQPWLLQGRGVRFRSRLLCSARFLMPKRLKRCYGSGHLHFITCSCYRRLPLLGRTRSRTVFVKILGEVRECHGFALVGYVVMPEHIHLLISEPTKGTHQPLCKCSGSESREHSAGKRAGERRPHNSLSISLRATAFCRNSGSAGFMISTCGAKRKESNNWNICTSTR